MIRSLLITLLLFPLCSITYGQQPVNGNPILDWKSLEGNNYSIEYPSDWELNQSGQMGTTFVLLTPQTSTTDLFRENINLLIQDLTGYTIDLDKYTEISKEQIGSMVKDSHIIESNRIKSEKGEYHKIIYTGTQDPLHLKFEQYYWVEDKKAFVLTLTCEENVFEKYQAQGERILNSFKIKK